MTTVLDKNVHNLAVTGTFDEAKKGSLEVGKFADLTVLSANPLTVAADQLASTASLMTMVGGKIVHETPGWHG